MMSQPRLEDISDYDTLKGEKKKVVLAVILAGLFMGAVYSLVYSMDEADDAIIVNDAIKIMPVR